MNRLTTLGAMVLILAGITGCPDAANEGQTTANEKRENQDSKKQMQENHSERERSNRGSASSDRKRGKEDAEKDIDSGKLIVRTLPLPSPPWASRHFQLVKRNGITLKSTKTPAEFKTEYIQAYNEQMQREIDKKFGKGFIDKLETQARQELEK